MQGRLTQLVDEVAKVRVVKIHVLVDICKTERTTVGGWRGWRV